MVKKIKIKYLIIGNSAGGVGAAEAIRQADREGTLAIVSDEPYPAYSRPLIAEYLATGCSLERMLYRPADFYQQHHIETYLGSEVARLDLGQHLAELADGTVITWEKLLLATGGLPIVPPMGGIGLGGVFTFTRLDDARAISQYLYRVRRAVVIGGGLIGVSVTEALSKRQVAVTVVEMKARLLNVMLDEETSAREEAALRQAGVGLVTGHTVAAINGGPGGDKVAGVTLDDGRRLPADLVVVAIGVRPRAGLAQGTDIKLNRGIVVDHHMATSYPGVYACGDVAEAPDFVYGECRLNPVWPNAYLGGRVAGFNMAGVATVYPGGTALNSLKYFGQDVISAGLVMPPDPSYETISHRYNGSYRRVVLKDGVVVGMVWGGDVEKAGIVYSLMKDRVDVAAFKHELVAEDFGLASLPEAIWRPRLTVVPSATASPAALTEGPAVVALGE